MARRIVAQFVNRKGEEVFSGCLLGLTCKTNTAMTRQKGGSTFESNKKNH